MIFDTQLDTIDGLIELYQECQNEDACKEGLEYVKDQINKKLTLREAINIFREDYSSWVRVYLAKILEPEIKMAFSNIATNNDPRLAAHWDLYLKDLSKNEQIMLRNRWYNPSKPLFPMIEKQVAIGIIALANIDG